MLPADFSSSRAKYPGLAPVFDELSNWIEANPRSRFIDVGAIRRLHPDLKLAPLLLALQLLVEEGIYSEAIAVVAPTNHALALDEEGRETGLYSSESEIPNELYDTALTPFHADEGEFVPVYTGTYRG